MKINFVIALLLCPILIMGQKKNNSDINPQLLTSVGVMPLEKGMALYSKTLLSIYETLGINLSFGYGISNPHSNYYNLSNIHTKGSFISGGAFLKTSGRMRGKKRKLSLYINPSLVFGKGKESAQYHFKGNDFGDYYSTLAYTQKYDFLYLQLALGATYRVSNKWNLEIGTYATNSSEKNRSGKQYFKIFGNTAYSYIGQIGVNFGMGYQLWPQKSKK